MVGDNSAWEGYGYAAYQRNVGYFDSSQNFNDANFPYTVVPSSFMEGDDGVPGLCGLGSGGWTDINNISGSYSIAPSSNPAAPPAGGSGWGQYLYFGGGKEVSPPGVTGLPTAIVTFDASATVDQVIYFQTAGFNIGNSCSNGPGGNGEDFTIEPINAPVCDSIPFFPGGASSGTACLSIPVAGQPPPFGNGGGYQDLSVTCSPPSGGGTNTVSVELGCPGGANADNNGAWVVVACTGSAGGIQVDVTIGLSDSCGASGPDKSVGMLSSGVVAPGTVAQLGTLIGSPPPFPTFGFGSDGTGDVCACLASFCGSCFSDSDVNICLYDRFSFGNVSVVNAGGF
jgi:hypothetical protein